MAGEEIRVSIDALNQAINDYKAKKQTMQVAYLQISNTMRELSNTWRGASSTKFAEQFDQLLYKYPMVHFLENPAYNDANNISSAVCARYLLQNAYVFEADLVISNPSIVTKYHYTSDFLGIFKERSDDWCFTVKNGIITEQKVGGLNVYQEVGISYWDEEAGRKLADDLKTAYEMPGGKERYWDQVPFSIFPEHYQVEVRPCLDSDIIEIDSFKELKAIDKTYDV